MTRKPNRSVVDAGVLLLSDPLPVVLEGEGRDGDGDSEGEPVVGDASLFAGNGGGDMAEPAAWRVYHIPVERGMGRGEQASDQQRG